MLSAAEFAQLHESMMDAMDFVALPVTFHRATAAAVDPLYGEAVGGDEVWTALPPIQATTRRKPAEEVLTALGVRGQVDLLVYIPHGYILKWEAAVGQPFVVTQAMELTFGGVRYAVDKVPLTDDFPVLLDGGGVGQDFLGLVICAAIKRDVSQG